MVESLLPNFDRFRECYENNVLGLRRDLMNAAAVAESCLHLADQVFAEEKVAVANSGISTVKSYRESLWTSQPSYEYVCNFADAWKHRELKRRDRKMSSVDDAQLICGIIRYEDQEGFYYDSRKLLTLKCLDGKTRDLAHMIFLSVQMWIGELLKRRKIDQPPTLKKLAPKFRRRQEVAPTPTVKFLGQKQEFFDEMIKFFIYDAATDAFQDVPPGEKFDTEIKCTAEIGGSPFTEPIDPEASMAPDSSS